MVGVTSEVFSPCVNDGAAVPPPLHSPRAIRAVPSTPALQRSGSLCLPLPPASWSWSWSIKWSYHLWFIQFLSKDFQLFPVCSAPKKPLIRDGKLTSSEPASVRLNHLSPHGWRLARIPLSCPSSTCLDTGRSHLGVVPAHRSQHSWLCPPGKTLQWPWYQRGKQQQVLASDLSLLARPCGHSDIVPSHRQAVQSLWTTSGLDRASMASGAPSAVVLLIASPSHHGVVPTHPTDPLSGQWDRCLLEGAPANSCCLGSQRREKRDWTQVVRYINHPTTS